MHGSAGHIRLYSQKKTRKKSKKEVITPARTHHTHTHIHTLTHTLTAEAQRSTCYTPGDSEPRMWVKQAVKAVDVSMFILAVPNYFIGLFKVFNICQLPRRR